MACDPNGELRSSVRSAILLTIFCRSGRLFFWYYIFYLSKVYEFVDTWIQLLKKREPPFLHVWHHCTTFLLCWVMFTLETSIQVRF